MDTRKELSKLNEETLITLMDEYDTYIQEANEEDKYRSGCCNRIQSPEEISEAIDNHEDTFDNRCKECRAIDMVD